jgi:hypothetical protein
MPMADFRVSSFDFRSFLTPGTWHLTRRLNLWSHRRMLGGEAGVPMGNAGCLLSIPPFPPSLTVSNSLIQEG